MFPRIRRQRYVTMQPDYFKHEYARRIGGVAANGRAIATVNVIYLVNTLARNKALPILQPPLENAAACMARELVARAGS